MEQWLRMAVQTDQTATAESSLLSALPSHPRVSERMRKWADSALFMVLTFCCLANKKRSRRVFCMTILCFLF